MPKEDLSGSSEGDEDKVFVKEELAKTAMWDAKGVTVDDKMLMGRRADRGFTVALGRKDVAADDGNRREKRASTMPCFGTRRGDYAMSEETINQLNEKSESIKTRFRRGSVSVAYDVVPEEEFQRAWQEHLDVFLVGVMTEGQKSADEREWKYDRGSSLPGPLPAIISCTKGCKGTRDTTPNQDNFSLAYMKDGYTMACCMDGHGPFGHMVSYRTVRTVPYYLLQSEHFPSNMEKALLEAFERAQKEVVAASLDQGWDVQASGSTAVAAVWKGNKVWTANCGDSRCVVGYETTNKLHFQTEDHKPDDPEEQARIHASGGEVRSQTYPDGWTVHRIFVKGFDYPGLCMARSLGDESVKAHGVIATPTVEFTEIDMSASPFLILATDGVWEFLESEFVVKAVAKKIKADGPERTVQKLGREARKRWRQEEGDYCDDITSMLIQLGDRGPA